MPPDAPQPARVLDVGNCTPDHYSIRNMIETHFHAAVDRVMFVEEACALLASQRYDLVLVNRLIFEDQSEGMRLVQRMKRDGLAPDTPVMLISNRDEAQRAAVEAGAVEGFGKARIGRLETVEQLGEFLPRRESSVRHFLG